MNHLLLLVSQALLTPSSTHGPQALQSVAPYAQTAFAERRGAGGKKGDKRYLFAASHVRCQIAPLHSQYYLLITPVYAFDDVSEIANVERKLQSKTLDWFASICHAQGDIVDAMAIPRDSKEEARKALHDYLELNKHGEPSMIVVAEDVED